MRALFSTACLAPLTLSVFACGSGNTVDPPTRADSGFLVPRDGGMNNNADSGMNNGGDAGMNNNGDAGNDVDAGDDTPDAGTADAGNQGCTYPANASEPMALNQPISSYSWPTAIDGDGTVRSLDFTEVFCNADGDVEWGDVDALLVVSLDAW